MFVFACDHLTALFRAVSRTKGRQMSRILNFERILCPVAESHETDEGLLDAIALARSSRSRHVGLNGEGKR
jgi:hypothetical protein